MLGGAMVDRYTVQPGDTPASIAIAFAGCPKCSRDLVAANRHKPTVIYPNGYETFTQLAAGEQLALPRTWFDGTLDRMPKSYFEALPSVDGGVSGRRIRGERALSAPPSLGSLEQAGLSYAGSGAYSFASQTLSSQLDPQTVAAIGQGLSIAGGWSGMTEQQQTQIGEGLADALAAAIVPGVGGLALQLLFSIGGTAGAGAGCCASNNCPPPSPISPPLPSTGGAGSFENMFNSLAAQQWIAGQTHNCEPGKAWAPIASWLAWGPMLAVAIDGWNQVTDQSGPATIDSDGSLSPDSGSGTLTIARTIRVPSQVQYGGHTITQYTAKFPDAIGVALDWAAQLANANALGVALDATTDPATWSVPVNSVVTFTVHQGGIRIVSVGGPGVPIYTPPPKTVAPPSSSSTTSKAVPIVLGTTAVAGGGLWLYSYLTHQTIQAATKALWKKVTRR